MFASRILGTGSYLPERCLTNADLEKLVDTTDAWITERTGIRSRHVAAEDQAASDLAVIAGKRAIEDAGLSPADIDLIVCATGTGDHIMPSTACVAQAKLGCGPIMAFDVSAACSGFIYALSVANAFVSAGQFKNVLVLGAEVLSRFTDFKDRGTCILFGDGAGAVVIGRATADQNSGILSQNFVADGSQHDMLGIPAGGSRLPTTPTTHADGHHFLRMRGREVFKSAVRTMSECCKQAILDAKLQVGQVDWLIPHQANLRIIDTINQYLEVPADRVVINIERTGNTSSASIPIALDEAIRDGRIKRGQTVLMTAFGSGTTSGAVLLRY